MIEVLHDARAPVILVDLRRGSVELAQALRTATVGGDVRVVVDMGERTDATSDVLSLLYRTARHLRRLGGSLAVVTSQPDVRRLLDVTLLSQAFPVFASRDEALRVLR